MGEGYAFISYSTKNQAAADALREFLNCKGVATWQAPGDIPVGSKYAQVINRAVRECSCFVLILTEDAQNSVWVSKEVERAINYRRPIVPVQLEDVTLNDEFELYISSDQLIAIQKIDEDSEEVQRLLAGIIPYTGVADSSLRACDIEGEQSLEPITSPRIPIHPEIQKRLLFIVDTSENMAGDYIEAVEKTVESLRQMFHLHFETSAAIDVLAYGDDCQWLGVEDRKLVAKGSSNAGQALSCLAAYGDVLPDDSVCCIIWVTARYPADDWRGTLGALKRQDWFAQAYRFALALGDDVDYGFLYQITSERDGVLPIKNLSQMSRLCSTLSYLAIKALKGTGSGDVRAILQELEQKGKERETFGRKAVNNTPQPKALSKTKKSRDPQLSYFGMKKAQKMFPDIPEIIELPTRTNVVLSGAFSQVKRSKETVSVLDIIVPEGVIELRDHAFDHLEIQRRIFLPSTLKQIGEDAFALGPNAYVDCQMGSVAYAYCRERGIRTSADMNLWQQFGRCQYCGGNFSILKKCKKCGRRKDY